MTKVTDSIQHASLLATNLAVLIARKYQAVLAEADSDKYTSLLTKKAY